MKQYKIENPEFIDLEKTKVRFTMVNEDGTRSRAEFSVPEGRRRGVNKAWDRILDEFDVEKMRQERNKRETEKRKAESHGVEKRKADFERQRLKNLFDAKAKAFELPFIKEADVDVRAAVRRAPNHEILNLIVSDLIRDFMKENNMSHTDYLDYLDDLEEEKEEK